MTQSRIECRVTILAAAILARWSEWEAEAEMSAQQEQTSEAYDFVMMKHLEDAIRRELKAMLRDGVR